MRKERDESESRPGAVSSPTRAGREELENCEKKRALSWVEKNAGERCGRRHVSPVLARTVLCQRLHSVYCWLSHVFRPLVHMVLFTSLPWFT